MCRSRLSFVIVFPLLILFFHGCAVTIDSNENADDILGIWVLNYDFNEFTYDVIEFQRGGDKCEIGIEIANTSGVEITLYWNTWHVKDGVIYTTMLATTSNILIGREINDRILKLSKTELVTVMIEPEWEEAMEEVHFKNVNAREGQVCSIVKTALHDQVQERAAIRRP